MLKLIASILLLLISFCTLSTSNQQPWYLCKDKHGGLMFYGSPCMDEPADSTIVPKIKSGNTRPTRESSNHQLTISKPDRIETSGQVSINKKSIKVIDSLAFHSIKDNKIEILLSPIQLRADKTRTNLNRITRKLDRLGSNYALFTIRFEPNRVARKNVIKQYWIVVKNPSGSEKIIINRTGKRSIEDFRFLSYRQLENNARLKLSMQGRESRLNTIYSWDFSINSMTILN